MKKLISSPGKLILFGEHSVVYGRPALATSLEKRTFILLEKTGGDSVEVVMDGIYQEIWCLDDVLKEFVKDDDFDVMNPVFDALLLSFVKERVQAQFEAVYVLWYFVYAIGRGLKLGMKISMKTDLEIGVGLGSSASFSTSLVTALLWAYGVIPDEDDLTETELDLINKWSLISETIFHGQPSGIDNTVCTYGGAIYMEKGNFERIRPVHLNVLVTNTKIPKSTKALVAKVSGLRHLLPEIIDKIFDAVGDISLRAKNIFINYEDMDFLEVEEQTEKQLEIEAQIEMMMTINHNLLNAMGVGHPLLDKIVDITSQHQLYSKLTGAGGGGCAYTVIKNNAPESVVQIVKSKLEECGFTSFEAQLGTEGVKFHSEDEIPTIFSQ